MTSRERVLTSLSHREPDRVPVDLGATPSSGISAIAYNNLMRHLHLEGGHNRVYDVVQQVTQPEDMFLDRFSIDVIDVGRAFNTLDTDWHAVALPDGSKAEYPSWFHPAKQSDGSFHAFSQDGTLVGRMPIGATFFDQTAFPYLDEYPSNYDQLGAAMGKVVWQALPHSPWDHAGEADFFAQLRARTLKLRASSDRAILIVCGCNLFEWGTFLRRLDNFLMDLLAEPEEVEKLLDALLERHLATLAKVCEAVGDLADVIRFGDDLGMDSGPFMSPEVYRRLFKPRHAQLCGFVHKNSGMKTFLHTCGSIYKLIPDLIDAGYDVLNPMQTNSRDMEPERLKREFGRDVSFWGGGVDTRSILNRGTPEQVREDVLRRLEILAPGGGYVFNPIHNIMPDCPPENIVAMFDAVAEFGR